MKADSIHLFDFLGNSKTIFEIPVFQRNYEWDKAQCKQLFKDLVNAAQTHTDHFIGAVVYVTETGKKMSHIYRIIDGQQRLTSLTLLLKALANADEQNKDEIEEQYLSNKYLDENNHFKLKPVEHDYDAFISVMNNMTDNSPASKVIENYNLFCKLIQDSDLSSSELYEAMNHFTMVYIELSNDPNEENPQVIFESLNSTGVSLSASDLVRNFLLMKLDSVLQSELYEKYWIRIERMFSTNVFAEFIRHYLIMKTHKAVKRNSVYDSYKDFYENEGLTSSEALADLYKFASYYYDLVNSKTGNFTFDQSLRHINMMDSKVVFPYFMLLLDLVKNGDIEQSYANDLVHIVEDYLFRIKVCHLPNNRMNKIVVALCDIEKDNGNLKLRLLRMLKSTFPDDKKVTESLMTVDLYRQRNHLAKLSLEILEENRTKETITFEDAQVEHVMPQNLNSEWRLQVTNADKINDQYGGTIGNLTLTKYNQEMSNKLYGEKRDFYKESNISLTRDIATEFDHWDKETILERSRKLANALLDIFPMPNISEVEAKEITGEYNIDDSIDVTGKKPTKITIDENEYTVDSWRQMLISFLNDIWNKDSRSLEIVKSDEQLNNMLFNVRQSSAKLDNGMDIETNYSATVILAIIAKISELCDITNQVSYTVK